MTIKTLIIEDVRANRETLIKLLEGSQHDLDICGEAETVEDGYQLISEHQPDLVFLDIQLKDGTGFDILSQFHKENRINFEIIFFTAHGNFENATKAIEYSALEFITKPVDPEKLALALEKAEKKIKESNVASTQYNDQISLLLENLGRGNLKGKRIAIHLIKGIIEFVNVEEIVYLQAEGTITRVFLEDGSSLTAVKNLGNYSKLLTSDYNFFPISNSIVVNLDYVKRYNHGELTVILTTGESLFASRRGGQDFKKLLNDNKGRFGNLEGSGLVGFFKRIIGN